MLCVIYIKQFTELQYLQNIDHILYLNKVHCISIVLQYLSSAIDENFALNNFVLNFIV